MFRSDYNTVRQAMMLQFVDARMLYVDIDGNLPDLRPRRAARVASVASAVARYALMLVQSTPLSSVG